MFKIHINVYVSELLMSEIEIFGTSFMLLNNKLLNLRRVFSFVVIII